MINEFRAAYVRAGSDSVQLGFGNKYADLVGIPNVNVTDNNSGFPAISIGGLGLVGESPFFPLIEIERSEEHTSELQSRLHLVCRLLLEKKKKREHRYDLIL